MDLKAFRKIVVIYLLMPVCGGIAWLNMHLLNRGVGIPKAVQTLLDDVVGVGGTIATGALPSLIKQPRLKRSWASVGLMLGIPLLALGVAINFSAVRRRKIIGLDNPDHLVIGGAYRYMRHPTYTANLLLTLGWSLCLASPYSVAALPIPATYVLLQSMAEEKFQLEPAFGEDYQEYRRATPAFCHAPLALALASVYLFAIAACIAGTD